MAFEVDELCPVARWQEGGYASAKACALDYNNVDAAHRRCNQWRGKKTVAQVLALARGANNQQGRAVRGSGAGRW